MDTDRRLRDTASSSVYPMSTSPETRPTDDDEESEEEGENNEEGMESEGVEEIERSELIPEKGEGHMHEREPFLKRDKVLAASDGHNIGGQKWPKLGLDCTEGRMVRFQEKPWICKLTLLLESDRLFSGMCSFVWSLKLISFIQFDGECSVMVGKLSQFPTSAHSQFSILNDICVPQCTLGLRRFGLGGFHAQKNLVLPQLYAFNKGS